MLVSQMVCKHGCPSTCICDNTWYYVSFHPEANGIAESKVKPQNTVSDLEFNKSCKKHSYGRWSTNDIKWTTNEARNSDIAKFILYRYLSEISPNFPIIDCLNRVLFNVSSNSKVINLKKGTEIAECWKEFIEKN